MNEPESNPTVNEPKEGENLQELLKDLVEVMDSHGSLGERGDKVPQGLEDNTPEVFKSEEEPEAETERANTGEVGFAEPPIVKEASELPLPEENWAGGTEDVEVEKLPLYGEERGDPTERREISELDAKLRDGSFDFEKYPSHSEREEINIPEIQDLFQGDEGPEQIEAFPSKEDLDQLEGPPPQKLDWSSVEKRPSGDLASARGPMDIPDSSEGGSLDVTTTESSPLDSNPWNVPERSPLEDTYPDRPTEMDLNTIQEMQRNDEIDFPEREDLTSEGVGGEMGMDSGREYMRGFGKEDQNRRELTEEDSVVKPPEANKPPPKPPEEPGPMRTPSMYDRPMPHFAKPAIRGRHPVMGVGI